MRSSSVVLSLMLWSVTGCGVIDSDAGPAQTSKEDLDVGGAESVRAEIRMGAGELHLESGGSKLMEGSFRYSEKVGKPDLHYDVTGGHGRLTLESAKNSSSTGRVVNEWNLRLGGQTPLDLMVSVGAGNSDVDVSRLLVRSVDVHAGAGDLKLNVAGKYSGDVNVKVETGAGSARIRLPKDMGAVVDASMGVGSVNVSGLTKRDGKYYNAAWVEGKPAVRVDVRGAVGDITLSIAD